MCRPPTFERLVVANQRSIGHRIADAKASLAIGNLETGPSQSRTFHRSQRCLVPSNLNYAQLASADDHGLSSPRHIRNRLGIDGDVAGGDWWSDVTENEAGNRAKQAWHVDKRPFPTVRGAGLHKAQNHQPTRDESQFRRET